MSAIVRGVEPIPATGSLRDKAYAQLRRAIVEADIYGSTQEIRLDEKQLTAALGVSRTPVREAVTLLEQEGFLRIVPRRGVFILRKSKDEIVEMIYSWAALESMAARLATQRASDADIVQLRERFGDSNHATTLDSGDVARDADLAFHRAIVELSKSKVILDTVENIRVHVDAIRRSCMREPTCAARLRLDRNRIIDALEHRDAALVENLVHRHPLDLVEFVERHCDFLT